MKRQRCDIFKVAKRVNVVLRDPVSRRFGCDRRRVCYAKRALRRIGHSHGEPHLEVVLRLIVESGDNNTELYSDTIRAVSDVLIAHPKLLNRGAALYEDFDRLDLAKIRNDAKAMELGLPLSHVMRVMIGMHLVGPA